MTNSNLFQYTIQPGDTLEDLAGWYDTTVAELEAVNPRIDPNNLIIGQVILIPESPRQANELWPIGGPWGWGPWGVPPIVRPWGWGFGPWQPFGFPWRRW